MKIELTEHELATILSALNVARDAEIAKSKSRRTDAMDRQGHVLRAERFRNSATSLLIKSVEASLAGRTERRAAGE